MNEEDWAFVVNHRSFLFIKEDGIPKLSIELGQYLLTQTIKTLPLRISILFSDKLSSNYKKNSNKNSYS
jgi:hypothetical protein